MKKLLVAAAALALAASTVPVLTGPALAAPAQNPFCKMAHAQKNLVAWDAYYHCLGTAPRPTHTALRRRPGPPESPFCKMAHAQKNLVAWNAYYHCLR